MPPAIVLAQSLLTSGELIIVSARPAAGADRFRASEARQILFSLVIRESAKPIHTIANILARQSQ
jgi:hypothetical protein